MLIVGFGAAGGLGRRHSPPPRPMLLLEGGRKIDVAEMNCHAWPYELPQRGFGFRHQAAMYPDGIDREAIIRGDQISVSRVRNLGGRTFTGTQRGVYLSVFIDTTGIKRRKLL